MIHSRLLASWFLAAAAFHAMAQPPLASELPVGAPVSLVFTTELNSSTAAIGDPVGFVLASDLKLDGVVLAKAGSSASGRVIHVKRASLAGRSGSLGLRMDDLPVGNDLVELRETRETPGSEVKIGRPYHLKWPFGLLRSGDELEIKKGTPLTVFVGKTSPTSASH